MANVREMTLVVESTNEPGAISGYTVIAYAGTDTSKKHSLQLPLKIAELPHNRADVASWVSQVKMPDLEHGESEPRELAKMFGAALFKALFVGDIEEVYRNFVRNPRDDEHHRRLRLELPHELMSIPWELLYDSHYESRMHLAVHRRMALVRSLKSNPTPADLVIGSLHILFVGASPDDILPEIDITSEFNNLSDELAPLFRDNKLTLNKVERRRDTLHAMESWLSESKNNPVNVLHILCHGKVNSRTGALIFEREDGEQKEVTTETLQSFITEHASRIHLVVVNACRGAVAPTDDPFGSVANALLRGGVSAVVAMQFDFYDTVAAEFSSKLYSCLADGDPIDLALTQARHALLEKYSLDWAVPVLFMPPLTERTFDQKEQQKQGIKRQLIMAQRFMKNGKLSEALKIYEEADRTAPDQLSPDDRTNLERCQEIFEIISNAAELVARATQTDDENIEEEEWEIAKENLEDVISTYPDFKHSEHDLTELHTNVAGEYALSQARRFNDKHDWEGIRAVLVELLKEFPEEVLDTKDKLRQLHVQTELKATTSVHDDRNVFASIVESNAVPIYIRLTAARRLEELEDPRTGVCKLPRSLEDEYWSKMFPSGSYNVGTQRDSYNDETFEPVQVDLAEFRVGRYPVTVWQYRKFVEAKGYEREQLM